MWHLVLVLLAGWLTGKLLNRYVPKPDATVIPGIPLIGNAVALGRLGVSFLNKCRKKYGNVFTLELVGQRMTFLFDPPLIDTFFKAPDSQITFRPAVEQFTQRVFGLPSQEFFPKHYEILTHLRHLLVPGKLQQHATALGGRVQELLPSLLPEGGEKVDLVAAIRTLIFQSATDVLFGPKLLRMEAGLAPKLEAAFFEFEHGFELAASPVPHVLQPKFTAARQQLLGWLRQAYESGMFKGTPVGELIEGSGLRPQLAPNLLLALMWASQANTVAATFWAVGMLLLPEHSAHLDAVRRELAQELEEAAAGSAAGGAGQHQAAALVAAAYKLAADRKSVASRCAAEAIRLRVQSIDVRIAADDLELPTPDGRKVCLPKGRILAVCPFENHHDSGMYPPDAWAFNPDRAPLQLEDGTSVVPGVAGLAFGGGAYRCPGRFFAEMEVALVLQLVLHARDLQLLPAGAAAAPAPAADAAAGGSPAVGGAAGAAAASGSWGALLAAAEPLLRSAMGDEAVAWGLGLVGAGSGSQAAAPGAAAAAGSSGAVAPAPGGDAALERWRTSGDPSGLLPECDLTRLVGVKVPAGPCWVKVGGR